MSEAVQRNRQRGIVTNVVVRVAVITHGQKARLRFERLQTSVTAPVFFGNLSAIQSHHLSSLSRFLHSYLLFQDPTVEFANLSDVRCFRFP